MLHYAHIAIGIVALIAAVYYGYLFYTNYQEIAAQPGEWKPWERLWAAGSGSATKLWARVVGIVASGMAALVGLVPFLGMPEVADFIRINLPAQSVTVALLIIAVITELARNRTA